MTFYFKLNLCSGTGATRKSQRSSSTPSAAAAQAGPTRTVYGITTGHDRAVGEAIHDSTGAVIGHVRDVIFEDQQNSCTDVCVFVCDLDAIGQNQIDLNGQTVRLNGAGALNRQDLIDQQTVIKFIDNSVYYALYV